MSRKVVVALCSLSVSCIIVAILFSRVQLTPLRDNTQTIEPAPAPEQPAMAARYQPDSEPRVEEPVTSRLSVAAGSAASVVQGAVAQVTPALQTNVAPAEAFFANPAIPLEQRRARIGELKIRGDAESVQTLIALAESDVYLNAAAVEALGWLDEAQTRLCLERMVADSTSTLVRRLCAAVGALAHIKGADAVPDIAALLKKNRERHDGLNEMVEIACVDALRSLRSPKAIPALAEELALFGKGPRQDLQYGDAVARAVWESAPGDPAAVQPLNAYIADLERRLPGFLEASKKEMAERGFDDTRVAEGERMITASYRNYIENVRKLLANANANAAQRP